MYFWWEFMWVVWHVVGSHRKCVVLVEKKSRGHAINYMYFSRLIMYYIHNGTYRVMPETGATWRCEWRVRWRCAAHGPAELRGGNGSLQEVRAPGGLLQCNEREKKTETISAVWYAISISAAEVNTLVVVIVCRCQTNFVSSWSIPQTLCSCCWCWLWCIWSRSCCCCCRSIDMQSKQISSVPSLGLWLLLLSVLSSIDGPFHKATIIASPSIEPARNISRSTTKTNCVTTITDVVKSQLI